MPYWTGKRFAPEVVASIDQAVSHFAARVPGAAHPSDRLFRRRCTGRARGGTSHRHRIDPHGRGQSCHALVNRLHDVSSMPQSENAIDFAKQVASIAQVHFSGADDTVVPPIVAQRFVDATGKRCAQAHTVPGITHGGDWSRLWPRLWAWRRLQRTVRDPPGTPDKGMTPSPSTLWLTGLSAAGKTTLAHALAQALTARRRRLPDS
ncbi:adenylyl-sulfate kinase [Ralstonia solanacearum]|uniref:adenylyl-sulfate kinase n=1 Tax=Ralstonia solanacearum TaxID=305 RepID=UPI002E215430